MDGLLADTQVPSNQLYNFPQQPITIYRMLHDTNETFIGCIHYSQVRLNERRDGNHHATSKGHNTIV